MVRWVYLRASPFLGRRTGVKRGCVIQGDDGTRARQMTSACLLFFFLSLCSPSLLFFSAVCLSLSWETGLTRHPQT